MNLNSSAEGGFYARWLDNGRKVVAVKPRPELEPFFKLSYECHARDIGCDLGGHRDLVQYLDAGYYPVNAPIDIYFTWKGKLSPNLFLEVKNQHVTKSLRQLAREYGVSYETVRRTISRALPFNQGVAGSGPARPTS